MFALELENRGEVGVAIFVAMKETFEPKVLFKLGAVALPWVEHDNQDPRATGIVGRADPAGLWEIDGW